MIWAIVQLSTKETQFFCVMKVIDGGVLPEFPIEEFAHELEKNWSQKVKLWLSVRSKKILAKKKLEHPTLLG